MNTNINSQNDILNYSKVEVNPREDDSWSDVICNGKNFNKYMDNISFNYEDGTITIIIPRTIFVTDVEAQNDIRRVLDKWIREGKSHLIEALGCAVTGKCSDKEPCTCRDSLNYLAHYLGEEKKLSTKTEVFDIKDCIFYKYM